MKRFLVYQVSFLSGFWFTSQPEVFIVNFGLFFKVDYDYKYFRLTGEPKTRQERHLVNQKSFHKGSAVIFFKIYL